MNNTMKLKNKSQCQPISGIAGKRVHLVLLTVGWLLSVNLSFSDTTWHLVAADMRFEMEICSRPTDPSAGIIAIIPDAGILPRSKFKPTVVDPKGKLLKSETLWHNPTEGMAVVFEPTEANTVFIYIQPSNKKLKLVSSFRPSLLLYVRNGNASLEQAHVLANKAPVGNDIFFAVVDRIFHSILPVGRDENTSSYYTGWFKSPKPGKTYFYTVSMDGSEFFIDNKLVHSWPGRHSREGGKRCEHGDWANLKPGPHKIEYFHFCIHRTMRESQFGWQTLCETKVFNPKVLGKKQITAAPMESENFVHSGIATLVKAVSRKGPLSIFSFEWESFINPYEEPTCLFRLHASNIDNQTSDTTYEWNFGDNRKMKGKNAVWLLEKKSDQRVTLTLSAGHKTSRSTRIIFPKSLDPENDPPMLSITNAQTRRLYSDVFMSMCNAVPPNQRPCESWSISMWKGLLAVLDTYTDKKLLKNVFDRSRRDILKLPPAIRWSLEEKFFEVIRQTDQRKAVSWLKRFEKEEKDMARKQYWKAMNVEFYLYDANDINRARIAAQRFMSITSGTKKSPLAMIRMGDVERFSGNFDKAKKLYGKAQDYHRRFANINMPILPGKKTGPLRSGQPASVGKFETSVHDWQISAVQEATLCITVLSMIEQQALTEAKQTLDQWEMAFPLNKLAGDYPLAESKYYMARQNYKRARRILMEYRKSVDLSNCLPDAMKLEFECLINMGLNKEARDLARIIIKRLPNHPIAQKAEDLLSPDHKGKLTLIPEDESTPWTETEKVDSSRLANLFRADVKIENNAEATDQESGVRIQESE